jgi:hypothetical protein
MSNLISRRAWHPLASGGVSCDLCEVPCILREGEHGRCFIRVCQGSALTVDAYGSTRGYCAIGDELPQLGVEPRRRSESLSR